MPDVLTRPPPGDLAAVLAALDPTTTAGEVWTETHTSAVAAQLDAMLPPRVGRVYEVALPRAVPCPTRPGGVRFVDRPARAMPAGEGA